MAYLESAMGLISLNYANYSRKHAKFIHPQGAFLLLSDSKRKVFSKNLVNQETLGILQAKERISLMSH